MEATTETETETETTKLGRNPEDDLEILIARYAAAKVNVAKLDDFNDENGKRSLAYLRRDSLARAIADLTLFMRHQEACDLIMRADRELERVDTENRELRVTVASLSAELHAEREISRVFSKQRARASKTSTKRGRK